MTDTRHIDCDILILGGGLGGIAAALRAAAQGYKVCLTEENPWIGGQCRFHPTCSHYAMDALRRHGLKAGGWLALKRLGRCHPFHPGGVDDVPVRPATAAGRPNHS